MEVIMSLALYWVFVLGRLQGVFIFFAVVLAVIIIILICIKFWCCEEKDKIDEKINKIITIKKIIFMTIFFIFISILCCFIPNTKQMGVIFVLSKLEKTEFSNELGKLPTKTVKILNSLLDNYLNDLKDSISGETKKDVE
jgi:hypothetical protein